MKKFMALALCLLMVLSVCGCGLRYEDPIVSFTAAGGTGYEWQCTVDDETVAAVEITPQVSGGAPGSPVNYVFTFRGVAPGETTAVFTFGRSWENACTKCACTVTVDEKLHVTLGELSEKVLEIDMGSPDYEMICFDTDVVTARQSEESGIFTFTAIQSGTTRVDFFYMPAEDENTEEEFTDRAYEITVDEEGMIFWAEVEADEEGNVDMGFADFTSAKLLAAETGLFVPELKEMKNCEYTQIREMGLAYVNFTWEDVPIAYAAGSTSLEGLTDDTTVEKTVAGTKVYVTTGSDSDAERHDVTAVWEHDGTYCYIASEDDGFTDELMETVLAAIIEAQNA